MAGPDLHIKAMDALVLMHTAIKNVQLYPPASPTIAASIERFHQHLQDFLKMESPLIFAESEKRAILRGKVLNQKDQEAIHIAFLLDILLNLGVKDIFFDKGLGKEELATFIKLLAKRPETVLKEGGLAKLMTEHKISRIYLDKKVYVSMDKEKEALSDKDTAAPESPEALHSESINQLTENLTAADEGSREQAAEEIVKMIEALPFDEQINVLRDVSEKLIEWIKLETRVTSVYKKVCYGLQTLIQNFILQERFSEAAPVMHVFSDIYTGALRKDERIREVSREILQDLATQDNVQILFREHFTNEKKKGAEAGQMLSAFDDIIINRLLDMIRDGNDSNERVRVIHLINGLGARAIPAIKERISNLSAPWYYLRNLAYILGHVGNEASAYILQPLLLHKNEKVRTEALKSISQTGRNQRGPLLLSVLSQVDHDLKISIVEMLGKMKSVEAVPNLLEMLKSKSSLPKDQLIALQEKICNALGAIGSRDAVKTLSEISESKSFLGIGSYPVEVKYAAQRALTSITRKQGEDSRR